MKCFVTLLMLSELSLFAQPTNLPCDVATKIVAGYSVVSNGWITLNWPGNQYATARSVQRRVYTNAPAYWQTWSNLYSSVAAADQSGSYTDTNVNVGIHYEYEVGMLTTNIVCDGNTNFPTWYYEYINTGIQVPAIATNGNVCLLVESGVATGLATELATLTNDLVMSGYKVFRHDVAADDVGSGTWSNAVVSVKTTVTNDFNTDPNTPWTLYIVGHVPIPYSGNSSPGGHTDNVGAHPADWYYVVTNGWTDTTVNNVTGSYASQNNVPSDGKFDQSTVPGIPIMRLGRVDLRNLPAFTNSETQLLSQYLNRSHSWRTKGFAVRNLGLINSNNNVGLIYRGRPYEEHSVLSSMFGTTNQTILGTWLGGDGANTNGYLIAASSGNGLYNEDVQIGYTTNFAATNLYAPFVSMYGSYYGDWDSSIFTNAVLQAPLAAGGYCVNNYYRENIMNMDSPSMGRTWGQKLFEDASSFPSDFGKRYKQNAYINGSLFYTTQSLADYVSLMGDPTLRIYQVAQPQTVTMQAAGTNAMIYWSPPVGESNVVGYYVYRAPGTNRNAFTLLTPVPTNAPFMDVSGPDTNQTWWVRTVKLQTNANRSFYDVSQGTLWNGVMHTNYYVMTNGSDSNVGTEASPFLTVNKGFNVARPGDRIIVGTGTYAANAQTVRDGSAGLPIVLDGQSVASITNILVSHQYITVQNCTFTGNTNAFSRLVYLDRGGSFCVLSNNILDMAYAPLVYGIQWNAPATGPFGSPVANSVTVVSNTIEHCGGYIMVINYGDFNLFKGNTLIDSPQSDCFNVFGRSNVITANLCYNFWENTNYANHSDIIQTYGVNGYGCQYTTVSSNIFVGVTNGGTTEIALSQLTASLLPEVSDFTFYNNLYVNIGLAGSCTIPNVKYYNNTFIRCDSYNKGPVMVWSTNSYSGSGFGGTSGTEWAEGGRCFNNVFYECGDLDGPNVNSTGWYSFVAGLTNAAADYNSVIKSNYTAVATNNLHQSIGDPGGWNNFAFWETHGFNGGNPHFIDETGYGGGWAVGTNSFLYNAGTNLSALFTTDITGKTRPSVGAWTIGAFEAATGGGQSTSTASSTSIGVGATISIGGGSNVYFQ